MEIFSKVVLNKAQAIISSQGRSLEQNCQVHVFAFNYVSDPNDLALLSILDPHHISIEISLSSLSWKLNFISSSLRSSRRVYPDFENQLHILLSIVTNLSFFLTRMSLRILWINRQRIFRFRLRMKFTVLPGLEAHFQRSLGNTYYKASTRRDTIRLCHYTQSLDA